MDKKEAITAAIAALGTLADPETLIDLTTVLAELDEAQAQANLEAMRLRLETKLAASGIADADAAATAQKCVDQIADAWVMLQRTGGEA